MKILFIQTGGTIDKDYPKNMNGYAFEIGAPAATHILERLNPSFDYEIKEELKKDSTEITELDRKQLLDVILKSNCEKVVITHGTDTLKQTADFIANKTDKTIVITGAMRPEKFKNSDADANLGMAIAAVQCKGQGVFVCMHGLVMPHDKVSRDKTSGKYILV